MEFTDTHTHLYEPDYGDGDAVDRAVQAGVTRMIFPDVASSSRERMFSLADRHKGVAFPCLGLHPTEIGADWKDEMDLLMSETGRDICAIGETGLDCYWSREFLDAQLEAFRLQLDLAYRKNLPVIIHCRDATELCLGILAEFKSKGLRGVMHAYSGSAETFRELEKLGDWYVGIGGVLTFKKASIAETVKQIPLERIVLETDAPWLAPVPYRGTRNESAYIPVIAAKLAGIKGIDIEEVATTTTRNARTLFNI